MEKSVDSLPSMAEESVVSSAPPPPVKEELIKINLPVFESYLNSIKDQLNRHDKQLESPAWLDDLKRESDKIAALARRLEHTQLDVNTIKDFIYYPPSSGTKEKQRKDPMLLLQADVESLKLVARRIDLYQSEDLNVYVQLKKLQKDYYDLVKMIEKLDKDSVINAMKIDFNNKINEANSRMDALTNTVEEYHHTLDDKIEEVHQTVDMEMKDRIKDVQDQINAFLSDGEEGGDEGGSDKDPNETLDSFNDALDTEEIVKPSQMSTPPATEGRKTVRSGGRETNVSFAGLGGYDETRTMGTVESAGRPTVRKTAVVLRSEETEAATGAVTSVNEDKGDNDIVEEEYDSFSAGNHRNSISNAVPQKRRATIQAAGNAASPANGPPVVGSLADFKPAPPRDTFRGSMMSLGGFSASGGKKSAKGGKFCTLEKFMGLVEEVEYLKHSLSMNVFKLRAHGVSRLQKVFAKLLSKESVKQKKTAFAKLHLNMQYKRENSMKRYTLLTIKTDFIIERALGRLQIKDYFARWKAQSERMQQGQRLYQYSHSIMKYWLNRVKPDIRKYMNIWKNFTVESFRRFVYNGLDETEAPAYDEFQHMLNGNFNMKAMMRIAHKDLLRRMAQKEARLKATTPQVTYAKDEEAEARTEAALSEMRQKVEASEEEGRVMRRDVLRLFALLEGNKQDMTAKIDKEATQIMGTINNFKSKVTTQLTHTGDLIEMNQKRNETNFSLHADISDALRVRIQDNEKELKFHEETQNSIINSQKSIRVEMDELLMKQEYIDSKFKQVSNEIMLNAKAMSVGIEEVRRVEKEYKDITTYYDSELNSMKAHSRTIENNLAAAIKNTEEKTNLLELKSDLLAANQDEVFPQKPQAYFVYKICQSYEKLMMRIHSEGGVNLQNKSIEQELSKISQDMAVEATRIAHYVVTAADRNVSHRLMETLMMQTAAPANVELEQKPVNQNITPAMTFAALGANNGVHNNHNTNVKNIPVSVQVVQEREALLNDFLNQFVNIMKEKDPHPGFVRGNARIVFHSKLKLTTEVLISKSHCMFNLQDTHQSSLTKRQYTGDSPVVGATLGETVSNETCMACNRPMSSTPPVVAGSRPPSALNRPSSASNGNSKSNQETAATIAQLQQQLANITHSLNRMKLLDPVEDTAPRLTIGGTTGLLRPHSASVLGSGTKHADKPGGGIAVGSGSNAVVVVATGGGGGGGGAAAAGGGEGGGGGSGGGTDHPKLKRKGTFHNSVTNSNHNNQEDDYDGLEEDLLMVDREHSTHMNTRRNSNSNLSYHLNENDFHRGNHRAHETMTSSSLSRSGSASPPLGGVTLSDEHTFHHIVQSEPVSASAAYDEEPEFDSEGFHQYLEKPYNSKKKNPTSSGAVRHREAVHKSHAMLLTTQGGGFKTSPAMSQEEMINELTASFHADVSMPRDINMDRSDLLFTESENMLREIQQHALNDESGLRRALVEGYPGGDGNGHHSPSGMVLSQSDSHLLGSRRLVGTSKTKKTGNSTMSFD